MSFILLNAVSVKKKKMMSKGTSMIHKLDKATQNRHFPEVNGGKGSHARTSTKETREVYKANFDAINWEYKGKSFIKSGN